MLDIFYLTFRDDFSQENLDRVWDLAEKSDPNANIITVSHVQGIYNAHRQCAKQSSTENFFVIDADAWLLDDFDLGYDPSTAKDIYPNTPASKCTHVWRAKNPATGMLYGYGGVKLFHRDAFDGNSDVVDMTTTVASRGFPYYAVQSVSNITKFNSTPKKAWRGAFRECAKLAAGEVDWNNDTEKKIAQWTNPLEDCENREFVILGAKFGSDYGKMWSSDKSALRRINDWDWLDNVYNETVGEGDV